MKMSELREISNCLRNIANNFDKLDEIMNHQNNRITSLEKEVSRNETFKKKLRDLLNEEVPS